MPIIKFGDPNFDGSSTPLTFPLEVFRKYENMAEFKCYGFLFYPKIFFSHFFFAFKFVVFSVIVSLYKNISDLITDNGIWPKISCISLEKKNSQYFKNNELLRSFFFTQTPQSKPAFGNFSFISCFLFILIPFYFCFGSFLMFVFSLYVLFSRANSVFVWFWMFFPKQIPSLPNLNSSTNTEENQTHVFFFIFMKNSGKYCICNCFHCVLLEQNNNARFVEIFGKKIQSFLTFQNEIFLHWIFSKYYRIYW